MFQMLRLGPDSTNPLGRGPNAAVGPALDHSTGSVPERRFAMTDTPISSLDYKDLSEIRDAVPTLDLFAIRSLRRAGFDIVKSHPEDEPQQPKLHPHWTMTRPTAA